MPIVSPKIVESLIKEGPVIAPLGLWIWTHAYRVPEAMGKKAPLGVRIDGIKGAASLLKAPARTVEKYWPRFCELFEKGADGLYRPRLSRWPEVESWPMTSGGFLRYIQIGASSVVRLMKMGSSKQAWSAQRLALSLLSPASASKGRKRTEISLSSLLLSRWLKMGKPSQRRAIASLRGLGLLVLASESPRRASLASDLFSERSRWSDLSYPQPVEKPVENDPAKLRATTPPSYRGIKREEINKGAPRLDVISIFTGSLLGIRTKAAVKLAAYCASPEEATQWIESEADLLQTAREPTAAFLWAVKAKGSRPGKPSGTFRKQAKEKRELAAELMICRKRTDEEKAEERAEAAEMRRGREYLDGESAKVWIDKADALREEVGAYDFLHYLQPSRAVWLDGVLTLATIDAATAHSLEANYREEITRAIGMDFRAVSACEIAASHSAVRTR